MINKSIAIIDDDPVLLNIYSEALKISGYDVSSFSDPLLAYEHIKENSDKYSLLIIDDKMPNVNGLFMGTKLLRLSRTNLSNNWHCRQISLCYSTTSTFYC